MSYREAIRQLREQRGMSMSQLAAAMAERGVDLHISAIAKIETTDRAVTIEEMRCIADIFDVSIDALLGRKSTPKGDKAFLLNALAANLDVATAALKQAQTNLIGDAHRLEDFVLDTDEEQLIADAVALADKLGSLATETATLGPAATGKVQAEFFDPSPKKTAPATKTPANKAAARNIKGGKK